MERIILKRKSSNDSGTFGEINYCGKTFYTGELPYRDLNNDGYSDSDISCIRPGVYLAKVTYSERFSTNLYELFNVEKRFSIRIHSANFMGDKSKGYKCQLNGCIALGRSIGILNNQKAILQSKDAVKEFMTLLGNNDFELEVIGV